MKRFRWAVLAGCGIAAVLLIFATAGAAQGEHGLGGSTNCASPTKVGDPVFCTYTIRNNSDDFGDTMRAHSVLAVAQGAGGSVPSGNIFGSLAWVFTGTVTCAGGSGAGTLLSPRVGATSCDIADGARITSLPFSFYFAQPADATQPFIPMLAGYAATDLCDAPGTTNCPVQDLTVGVSSQTAVIKRDSATATQIHDGAHQTVTVVAAGTTVHDLVMVASADGGPVPTGNVNVDWFLNGDCSGAPVANSGSIGPLDAAGNLDAVGFNFTVNSAGFRAFRAHYEGSGTYNPSNGACEPLRVVDANIQLNPPTATNRVGTNHTLTCHINVNDGNGFVNAPAGTTCNGQILSGPGSFVGPSSCNTVGATGDCPLIISSAATGMTTIRASTDVSVTGISLHRETGDGHAGDSADAQKLWVNAKIEITPDATNEVGQPHTFTVTLSKDVGDNTGFHAAPSETVTVTLTPAGGATPTPAGPFTGTTNAAGQFQVTFTSPTTGTVTGHASSTLSVAGSAPFTVATDGVAPNSGDAVKRFVNANIQITPPNATNEVGTNHVLTITVNALGGTIDAGSHTATASIVSGPGSFVGSPTCTYTGGAATATCTVTITSASVGTTVVSATSAIPVSGVTITRTTNTAVNTAAGGSGNASKVWVNANIQIAPANATNPINTNHVLTITVNALNGTIGAGPHTATASIVSGPGSFVGSPTCTYTGGAATATCTVTITSASVGTTVVSATSNIPVSGVTITRTTDTAANTAAGGSGNAQKVWEFRDANIQINPPTANNPVGTNHTLIGHVNIDSGGGFVNAPAGTVINFSITSGPGSFVGGINSCATIGSTGSCTVQITSGTTRTTVVKATTDVVVAGQTLHRETDATGTNSGPASKNWADATVSTKVRNAANADVTGQAVDGGTVVHDEATVAKAAGTPAAVPNPTGTVDFTLYDNGTCNGTVIATDPGKPLNASGTATSATFTTPAAAGSFSYLAHYNGDANYPAHNGPCEPFSVRVVPTGQITPTQVSCEDFISGTAPNLDGIHYPASGGKIGQGIDPGKFFYWTKITTTVPNQVVTTSQSNTSTNNSALFKIHQGWQRLYTGNCSSWTAGTQIAGGTAASFTVPTPGTYVIGIKYDVKSLVGTNVPVPATITFNFGTSLGGQTGASVVMSPK